MNDSIPPLPPRVSLLSHIDDINCTYIVSKSVKITEVHWLSYLSIVTKYHYVNSNSYFTVYVGYLLLPRVETRS